MNIMNIKQSEFINSDGSVVLIGIPGGGNLQQL